MTGWGVTNLRDPDIRLDTPDDTVSVNVNDDLIIDSNDAVFWIAPQVYRGNKVCMSVSLSVCLSLCLSVCLFICLSVGDFDW